MQLTAGPRTLSHRSLTSFETSADDGRGVAERGRDGKLRIAVPNYPYAEDGLLIWEAMERWVGEYLHLYYKDGTTGHQVQALNPKPYKP